METDFIMRKIEISIIVCLSLIIFCGCSYFFDDIADNLTDKNIIEITKVGVPENTDYKCELLDDGVLKLIKYEETGHFESGGKKTWIFEIMQPGESKILWQYYEGHTLANEYVEIYTINDDYTYECKVETPRKYISYIFQCIDDLKKSNYGFFVDSNGYKRRFVVDYSDDSFLDIQKLYEYLLDNYDTFEKEEQLERDMLLQLNYFTNELSEDSENITNDENTKARYQCYLFACKLFGTTVKPVVIYGDGRQIIDNHDKPALEIRNIVDNNTDYWSIDK